MIDNVQFAHQNYNGRKYLFLKRLQASLKNDENMSFPHLTDLDEYLASTRNCRSGVRYI